VLTDTQLPSLTKAIYSGTIHYGVTEFGIRPLRMVMEAIKATQVASDKESII
jgi:hypothetical protein